MKKLHRSAKGRVIDMDEMRNAHGSQKAIGNASMNARGDILDSKGNIIKHRYDIVQEYYQNDKNAVKHISLKDKISNIPVLSGDELTKALQDAKTDKKRKLIDKED